MVVRMLVQLVGRDLNVLEGELYHCDEATGARMLAAGLAVPVSAPESAMAAVPVERAIKRRVRGR
jgi:hypothetical protein